MSSTAGEPGILWMGSLEPHMDEDFIRIAFAQAGVVICGVTIMNNNKSMGNPARFYGFVKFPNDFSALLAMHKLNNKVIPNSRPPTTFKLNHYAKKAVDKDCSLWIGDLSADVDDFALFCGFASLYPSVRTARVILDAQKRSRGFGFVQFTDEDEMRDALFKMDGCRGIGRHALKVRLSYDRSGGQTSGVADVTCSNLIHTPVNQSLTFVNMSGTYANLNSTYANPNSTYANPTSMFSNSSSTSANPSSSYRNPNSVAESQSSASVIASSTSVNPSLMFSNPGSTYASPSPSYRNLNSMAEGQIVLSEIASPTSVNPSSASTITNSTAAIEIDLVSDSEDEQDVPFFEYSQPQENRRCKQTTEQRDPLARNQFASDYVSTQLTSSATVCPPTVWSQCLVCNKKFEAKCRQAEDEEVAVQQISYLLKNCIGVPPRKCKELAQNIIQESEAGATAAVSLFCNTHQAIIEEANALSENLARPLEMLETKEEALRRAAGKWISGTEPLEGIGLIVCNALTRAYQNKLEQEKSAGGKFSFSQEHSRRGQTADVSSNLRDADLVMLTSEGSDDDNDCNKTTIRPVYTRFPANTDNSNSLPHTPALRDSRREASGGSKPPSSSQCQSSRSGIKECPRCTQLFYTVTERNDHFRNSHSDGINYQCYICKRLYSTFITMQKHIDNLHDSKKPFKCVKCGIRFGTKVRLQAHTKNCTKQRTKSLCQNKMPAVRKMKQNTTSKRMSIPCPASRKYRSQEHPSRSSKFQTQVYCERTDTGSENGISRRHYEADNRLPTTSENSLSASTQGYTTRSDGSRRDNRDGQENEEEIIVHLCFNCGLDFETRYELNRHKRTCGAFAQL